MQIKIIFRLCLNFNSISQKKIAQFYWEAPKKQINLQIFFSDMSMRNMKLLFGDLKSTKKWNKGFILFVKPTFPLFCVHPAGIELVFQHTNHYATIAEFLYLL